MAWVSEQRRDEVIAERGLRVAGYRARRWDPDVGFEGMNELLDSGAGFTGLLTALYGIGQIVGPPLVAWLLVRAPSQAQGFDWALSVAAGALVLGAVLYGFMVWRWRPVR